MQPTIRGIRILLLSAPILATATWLPIMQWLALVYFVLACLLIWFDWKTAEPIEKRFNVRREHDQKLSLGTDNPIKVFVRNRSNRPASVWLRDEEGELFERARARAERIPAGPTDMGGLAAGAIAARLDEGELVIVLWVEEPERRAGR